MKEHEKRLEQKVEEYKPKADILGVAGEKLNNLGADYVVAKKFCRPLQRFL